MFCGFPKYLLLLTNGIGQNEMGPLNLKKDETITFTLNIIITTKRIQTPQIVAFLLSYNNCRYQLDIIVFIIPTVLTTIWLTLSIKMSGR